MRIKLDENLPLELAGLLAAHGHDVHTVADESLVGCADAVVFTAAVAEQRLLFTPDLDFSDVRKFRPGTHPGIVLMRLRDPSRRRLIERIRHIVGTESIDTWLGCFVVITDRKLRVRRS